LRRVDPHAADEGPQREVAVRRDLDVAGE
jgi:hypothetical protein